MRKTTLAFVASLAVLPGLAQAAETPAPAPCVTPSEFSALAAYAMPSVIGAANKRCGPTLSETAYLPRNGTALAGRYAARKDAAWPMARKAFNKFTAADKKDTGAAMLASMPDSALREVIDVMVEGMVAQEIPLKQCATIDDYLRLLSPLPPENTAELIGLTLGLVSKGKEEGKVGKIVICQG